MLFIFSCFVVEMQAQQVDIKLQFNESDAIYEVYAIPDFDNDMYFVGGGSQISILLPQDIQDVSLLVNSANGGIWTDNSMIFAPGADHVHDFHGIASNGALVNFETGNPLLLFTFELPGGACRSDVRLYENVVDINDKAEGMNDSDFRNFFANVFEPYKNNWAKNEDVVSSACAAAPVVNSAVLEVQQDQTGTICLAIEDLNEGDYFEVTLCENANSSVNGSSMVTVEGNTLCLEYAPDTGFIGFDEVCVEVCDQTGLCNNAFVAVTVVPEVIYSTISANAGSCQTDLNWTVLQPNVFSHFELERSQDGVNFTVIGEFESTNQTNQLQFNFTDEQVVEDYFYRLRLVFEDQENQYSETVFVTADCDEATYYATISAEADFCENKINWTINNQNDVIGYSLERSSDGTTFEVIESYETNEVFNYTDTETRGDHFYRLKLLHANGTTTTTNNVFVDTECLLGEGDFVIYPNPASQSTEVINIKFFAETNKLNLLLTDALGRVVRRLNLETNVGVNTIKLDVSKIAPGTYFVTLDGKEVMTKSFVKLLD